MRVKSKSAQRPAGNGKSPVHIKDLLPDPKNLRAHNPRNVGMIRDALGEVGAARSIVIDESNTVLAGNATVEAAGEAGITKLKIVDADGDTIIAVRRTGLTKRQKQRLATFDNRTAELATWDSANVADLLAKDAEAFKGMFAEDELKALLNRVTAPGEFPTAGEDIETEHVCPKCGYRYSGGKTMVKE
jgi:hypothetical protein